MFCRHLSALRIFATCLMFVLTSFLPARADHVHQLYYNNSQWVDQDLTAMAGGPGACLLSLAALETPGSQLHAYYLDEAQSHVHQLYYNGVVVSFGDC